MEVSLLTTIATVASAVSLAYLNGFVVERYKRFSDGSALAAGIAGELGAYRSAFPILSSALREFVARLDGGSREGVALRSVDRPADRFYEASVGKLGLLGPELVEQVVYVYSQLNGMRVSMSLLAEKSDAMNDAEMLARLRITLQFLERASKAAEPLVSALRKRAATSFFPQGFWR